MKVYLDRFVIACLYAALFVPFVFQSDLMHPLVSLKAVLFQILIEFAFAGYLALLIAHAEYRPRFTRFMQAIVLVFTCFVLSAALGFNVGRSLWSSSERMTGLVFLVHLFAYFLMLVGMRGSFSWNRYLSWASAISFFVALFPVIQLIFPGIFFDRVGERLGGTIGNPIFLSSYLVIAVFLSGHLASVARRAGMRAWAMFAVIAMFDVVVIILTQTRGAFLGLIAGAAVLSLYAARRGHPRGFRYAVFGVWVVALAFGVIFFTTRHAAVWQSVPVLSRLSREGFNADARILAWKAGVRGFLDRPVFGWGFENFNFAFGAHYEPRLLRYGFHETYFDRPHNSFLGVLVEEGAIGFLACLFLGAFVMRRVRRIPWLVALFVAYAVQDFFAFDTIANYCLLAVVLAFAMYETDGHAPRHGGGMGPVALVPALVILLVAACSAAYFINYRIWRANHNEWNSINYFVQRYIPEGSDYFDLALAAPTPYHDYIVKDLAPNIAHLYAQDLPLDDAPGFVRRAVREMQGAIARNPNDFTFYIALADMAPEIYKLDPAYLDMSLATLDAAERISPNRQATRYVRARALGLKGDAAGALAAMKSAVDLDPEVGDAHFYYAMMLLEAKNAAQGVPELHRAEALGRIARNASEARTLGGFLGDMDLYEESQKQFLRALFLKPDDLESKMKLGIVYYWSGDRDAARRTIQEVMKTHNLKQSPQYQLIRPILLELGIGA